MNMMCGGKKNTCRCGVGGEERGGEEEGRGGGGRHTAITQYYTHHIKIVLHRQ